MGANGRMGHTKSIHEEVVHARVQRCGNQRHIEGGAHDACEGVSGLSASLRTAPSLAGLNMLTGHTCRQESMLAVFAQDIGGLPAGQQQSVHPVAPCELRKLPSEQIDA